MGDPVWRGHFAFRGRSAGQLAAVVIVVVVFAALASWNIGNAGFSDFYSTAAKSMSVSWRAFFFGSFDPSATITLDKLSGFLVPQALSARIFGFHAWSIALPEVIEGAVTVLAAYVIAARWRGWRVGMVAIVATASTPLFAPMFGHVMEDGLLTMSLALALLCWQAWSQNDRVRPLIFSALWVAVGFQAKMMQAWLILPALVIGIMLVGSSSLARRSGRALVFIGVALVASTLWMIVAQSIPAADRPYFDGSTNNSVFSMVFGYNGFNRLIPGLVPGAAPDFIGRIFGHTGAGASTAKLLSPAYATQVGWLYPLALVGAVAVVLLMVRRRRAPISPDVALGVVTALWLATAAAVLSLATVPHTAYFAAIAVQLALLAAFAISELVRGWRTGDLRARVVIALVVALQLAWTESLLVRTAVAPPWLLVAIPVTGIVAVILVFVRPRSTGSPGRWRMVAVLAGASVFLAPTVWSGSTLDPSLGGTANDAYAGPHLDGSPRFFRPRGTNSAVTSFAGFRIGSPVLAGPDPSLTAAERATVDYVWAHDGTAREATASFLLATTAWSTSEAYILAGGYPVLSVGGFSGSIDTPTLAQFESDVRTGRLRFVILAGNGFNFRPSAGGRAISTWVQSTCRAVPALHESSGPAASRLWDCGARPAR